MLRRCPPADAALGSRGTVRPGGAGTLLVVLGGTAYKVSEFVPGGRRGNAAGRPPDSRNTADLNERKTLNVVEEMAIAAGIPVPPVYLLENEPGINAFAAGYASSDAVIGITRGAVRQLSRMNSRA